jgi:predicted MPP superfamily phosphohydrolase
MESHAHPELLARALAPLRELPGRVFACLGNHDHEAPATVRLALHAAGVRLLVDEAETVMTDAGRVEVVGFDFTWRERSAHLRRVCAEYPRTPGVFRLALLHDPGAFRHLPPGEIDLVLSGHTHGGQVGFVSLGLPWTLMRLFAKIPDHGLWARGADKLYVHRGTGHYGFPLRLGVPAEESLLTVHAPELLPDELVFAK